MAPKYLFRKENIHSVSIFEHELLKYCWISKNPQVQYRKTAIQLNSTKWQMFRQTVNFAHTVDYLLLILVWCLVSPSILFVANVVNRCSYNNIIMIYDQQCRVFNYCSVHIILVLKIFDWWIFFLEIFKSKPLRCQIKVSGCYWNCSKRKVPHTTFILSLCTWYSILTIKIHVTSYLIIR